MTSHLRNFIFLNFHCARQNDVTSVFIASEMGHHEALRLLLDKGGDVNVSNQVHVLHTRVRTVCELRIPRYSHFPLEALKFLTSKRGFLMNGYSPFLLRAPGRVDTGPGRRLQGRCGRAQGPHRLRRRPLQDPPCKPPFSHPLSTDVDTLPAFILWLSQGALISFVLFLSSDIIPPPCSQERGLSVSHGSRATPRRLRLSERPLIERATQRRLRFS